MWSFVAGRPRRSAVVLGALLTLGLGAPTAAVAADLPTTGASLSTDGDRRFAVLAPDGTSVSVVDRATSRVGVTPLPATGAGVPLRSSILGFRGDQVVLLVEEETKASFVPERYAVVDADGGGFRWLCGQTDDVVAVGVPLCPYADGLGVYRPYAAGERWIRVYANVPHGRGWAFRWGLRDDGTFWWRKATAKESRRIQGGEHLDLDHAAPRPEEPFGLRIRFSVGGSSRTVAAFAVRRTSERRRSTLRLEDRARDGLDSPQLGSVQVGSSGTCIARRGELVLLDRRTRRVWRRAVPAFAPEADFEAACAGPTIVTRVGTALDWSLRRPTTAARAGWTSAGILRAGATLTVPAPAG